MKFWIRLKQAGSTDTISREWDPTLPLMFEGEKLKVLDAKGNFLYLTHVDEGKIEAFPIEGLSEKHVSFGLEDGSVIELEKFQEFEAVSEDEIRSYATQTYSLPEGDTIDPEEAFYSKLLKRTCFGGMAVMMLAVTINSFVDFSSPVEEELAEKEEEKKARVVKLRNAPKPDVIAAAYHKAMQKGLKQAKRNTKKAPPKKKKSTVASIKSAFSSLMSGGLSVPSNGGAKKAAPNRPVAVLKGVQNDGSALGARRGGGGRKKGDSVVKVAMIGGGDGAGYEVGGDAAGIGIGGVDGQGTNWVGLNIDNATVEEGLSRDEVGRVIHGRISEIRYCYESSMLRQPELEGKLVVDFTISAAGRVRTANVSNTSISDERLNECILKRLTRWDFPKPKAGVEVAVSYPFIFKRLRR